MDRRYQSHHVNALDSNIVLTDDNQNVLVRYGYDIFGAIRAETGTSDNTRKFTGKEFDADSNLYYYAARYYDPYIGRFTQRDPAGDGVNWYAYTANNPLSFIDPTGLRRVNARERDALIYTFGGEVGQFLAGRIDIVEDPSLGRAYVPFKVDGETNFSQIRMSGIYEDTDLLVWLGLLVHEATHLWQRHTNRHRGREGVDDYDYDLSKLLSTDLDSEEHAQAVQDWFLASYGVASGLIEGRDVTGIFNATFGTVGFSTREINEFTDSQKLDYLDHFYSTVRQELLQPHHIWTTHRFR
ncbi:RHS repeat-associated core domain-containing protein [Candidatus Poribacteria bacterium]|nr:RHS repeat-associated core domain-containing protein [Candidatus Poribacteria bacterium]